MNERIIFTIDVDAFFAQAEELRHPELKNIPVVVSSELNNRGVVTTANYIAREYGLYAGQPIYKAKQIIPNLTIVKPDYLYYVELSDKIFNLIATYSKEIEIASIDECYLDVSKKTTIRNAINFAKTIQKEILAKLHITVSVGIGNSRILSKVASKLEKPFGVSTIFDSQMEEKLWVLPVEEMHGIGLRTKQKLNDLNINTIGDLAKLNFNDQRYIYLREQIGINLEHLINLSNGKDNSQITNSYHNVKSLSHAETFPNLIGDYQILVDHLFRLTTILVEKLKYRNLLASSVSFQYRDKKNQINLEANVNVNPKKYRFLNKTLAFPTDDLELIFYSIMQLFDKWYKEGIEINYLGVSVSRFVEKFYYGEQQYIDTLSNNQEIDISDNKEINNLIKYLNHLNGEEIFASGWDFKTKKKFSDRSYSKKDTIKFKKWE